MKKTNVTYHNLTAVRIFQVLFWHRITFLHAAYYIFSVTYIFGCVNFIIKHVQEGGNFKDICLNISYILALSITFYAIHYIKKIKNHVLVIRDLLNANPYLVLNDRRVHEMLNRDHFLQISHLIYTAFLAVAGLCYVEIQQCDEEANPFACHYLIPSYFFIEIQKTYRMIYNVCTILCMAYHSVSGGVCVILLYSITVYMEIFVKIFKSTLDDIRLMRNKRIRQRKLISAYKQHMYMMR